MPRRQTAPRPPAPRCAAGCGSRWRSARARRRRSRSREVSTACRSRGMTCVATSSRRRPRRSITFASTDGGTEAYVPTAPESLPYGQLLEGVFEAVEVAVGLEGEAGEAEPEGRRLGVDAVGAPDAEGVAVLERTLDQGVAIGAGAGEHDLARLSELQRQGRVEDVGGGQPVVDPAPVLADRGGDDIDERGDVVVGDPLALVDCLDPERRLLPCRLGRLPRHDALHRPRLGCRQLHLQPALQLPLLRPDLTYLRTGIPGDHRATPIGRRPPARTRE